MKTSIGPYVDKPVYMNPCLSSIVFTYFPTNAPSLEDASLSFLLQNI